MLREVVMDAKPAAVPGRYVWNIAGASITIEVSADGAVCVDGKEVVAGSGAAPAGAAKPVTAAPNLPNAE